MDIEDRIRDAVREDRPEPSLQFHGRVMSSLPDRAVVGRRPAWASLDFARFVGLAAVVALAVAAVGLPLIQSRPGTATPGDSPISTAVETRSATAAPIGHFTLTGAMAMKGGGLATLLADGRVLVLGSSAKAELYDPGTGKFSPTGSMSTNRAGESATRLLDGRILIVGGDNETDLLATAELYDPATGRFSPTGSMAIGRQAHTATLLRDGRVLIAGGYHAGMGTAVFSGDAQASELGLARPSSSADPLRGGNLASAELYDPKTGKFSPTGSMAEGRNWATATLLSDGRVLIVGGLIDGTLTLSSAEVYDPATGSFSPTGSMPDARLLSSATLLADGRVLISGGLLMNGGSRTDVAIALLYEPQTGRFIQTGALAQPRDTATATRLEDGRVLVAGGFTWPSDVPASPKGPVSVSVSSVEIFDPTTGKFNDAGSMTIARAGHSATLLLDGRVLIVGGIDMTTTTADELGSAELYQP